MHRRFSPKNAKLSQFGHFPDLSVLRTHWRSSIPEPISPKTPSLTLRVRPGEELKITIICTAFVRSLYAFFPVFVRLLFGHG
jgi:hypothetical protein